MLTTQQLLYGLPADETLRFFATFARFEFAMKQCGFLRRTGHNRVAEASRDKLSAHLPADFFESIRVAQTASTLIVGYTINIHSICAKSKAVDQDNAGLSGAAIRNRSFRA
jgi:hypothetical protein